MAATRVTKNFWTHVYVASCSSSIRKRKNDNNDINIEPDSKLLKEYHQYYFVLESDDDSSDEDSGSGSSVSSIHNKSTDFAKSTSDTSSKTDESDRDLRGIEYEVVSCSEPEGPLPEDFCSSGTDSMQWKEQVLFSSQDSEEGEEREKAAWADGSSDASIAPTPSLPGVNFLKLRNCIKCRAKTPLLSFCRICHKTRKDLFPLRPKRQCGKKPNNSRLKKLKAREAPIVNSGSSSVETYTSGSSQEISELTTTLQPSTDVCGTCFKNPRNGGFLHSRWVHVISCYQCSLKIWFSRKCCPMCNGKIMRVIQVAIAQT